jgi:hypothetical protein
MPANVPLKHEKAANYCFPAFLRLFGPEPVEVGRRSFTPSRRRARNVSSGCSSARTRLWGRCAIEILIDDSIGLIQTDRGNFYRSRHTRGDVVWRDFYYATVYTVLSAIDERWSAPDVELTHPTGTKWPQDLVIVVREVIDHLNADSSLLLQRVHLSCLHGLTRERVDKAALELGAEPRSGHRPLAVETVELSAVGAPDLMGALVQRIDLPETA